MRVKATAVEVAMVAAPMFSEAMLRYEVSELSKVDADVRRLAAIAVSHARVLLEAAAEA